MLLQARAKLAVWPWGYSSFVEPIEARRRIAVAAAQLLSGEIDVLTLAHGFNGSLSDLCRDEPLSGDLLDLFFAFESWEVSFGANREEAAQKVKQAAQRLAAATSP